MLNDYADLTEYDRRGYFVSFRGMFVGVQTVTGRFGDAGKDRRRSDGTRTGSVVGCREGNTFRTRGTIETAGDHGIHR